MDWMHLNEIMFQEMELMKSIIICCKITDDSDSIVLTGPGSVIHFKKKIPIIHSSRKFKTSQQSMWIPAALKLIKNISIHVPKKECIGKYW